MVTKSYIIPGQPIAWARPGMNTYSKVIFDTQKGEKMVVATNLRFLCGASPVYKGPLAVSFKFYIEHGTKKEGSFHSCRPDIDNLVKFYLDAATGILYDDDKQIVKLDAVKLYAREGRTEITIEEL